MPPPETAVKFIMVPVRVGTPLVVASLSEIELVAVLKARVKVSPASLLVPTGRTHGLDVVSEIDVDE